MGVTKAKNLLRKTAKAFAVGQIDEKFLYKAAEIFVKAKMRARDNRDKWKLRKRLGT